MFYFNMFYFYSIIGYLLETIFLKDYMSGILFLPWTPIYGIGALVAVYIYKKLNNRFPKWLEILIHFIICALILSLIEFIGGHLIEFVFKKVYWDYNPLKYNLGKYVSLESAIIWGIGSSSITYLINPLFKKIFEKIPKIWTIIITVIFILDVIITLIVKTPLS